MVRRLATVLLGAAMIFASSVLAPCTGSAACTLAGAARMNCCTATHGISTPRCCSEHQQVRNATPAAPERPAQSMRVASAAHVVSTVHALTASARTNPLRRIDPPAAPPGGTLVAQHTSLLL